MAPGDGAELLGRWLEEHHRTVRPDQSDEVLAKFTASEGNPLYLRLAFEEARRWRSDEQPEDREHLATGVQGIIAANTFGRLAKEENHGDVLVSHALGYLAASRYGLAEDELLDVLSRDPEVYAWFMRSAHDVPPDLRDRANEYRKHTTDDELTQWLDAIRTGTQEKEHSELRAFLERVLPRKNGPRLPVVLWSRLFFDLRPYLTERAAEGATLITFFHRELEDTARHEFHGEHAPHYHTKLADYFRPEPGDDGRRNWEAASLRGLSELPYHLIKAQRWDEVEETLTDFDFLEAKISRVAVERSTDDDGNEVVAYTGVRRLLDDLDLALQELSGDEGTDQRRVIVTAADLGDGFVVRCPHCNVVHVFRGLCAPCHASHGVDEWLGKEITCPNKKCQEPLMVNEFTVGSVRRRRESPKRPPPSPGAPSPMSSDGAAPATSPGRTQKLLDAFAAALRREQHTLRSQPRLCFQQLHNRLQWDDEPVPALLDAARERHKADTGSAPWLRTRWPFRETRALRLTIAGHSGAVNGCAITPDGRRVVSASSDGTLKVWDLETGTENATLIGHTAAVNGCAVTPDGRRVVSASSDGTLKVWDLETGTETAAIRHKPYFDDPVRECAVSPDGRHVVSASRDGLLKVWDLESGTETATLPGHTDIVYGCAVTPDGHHIVSASWDDTLKVWNLSQRRKSREQRPLATVDCHSVGRCDVVSSLAFNTDVVSGGIYGVVLTPDGRKAISASFDGTLKVWDLKTGTATATLSGHTAAVTGCAVSPDGRRVVSASGDQTLKVWDLETGAETTTLIGHTGSVNGCAVTPDGRRVVSVSDDGTLKVWDLETGAETSPPAGHTDAVTGCVVSPDGRRVVSASGDQTLKVWDLETGTETATLTGIDGRVETCVVSPDGRHVVAATDNNKLTVWDLETGTKTATIFGHSQGTRFAISPDGRRIVSSSNDGTQENYGRILKVWDLETGAETAILTGHTDVVTECAVTPDGHCIVSASEDHTLRVWDLETGTETAALAGHTDTFTGCVVSPDGRHLVSATEDHTLKVWDLETGTETASLTGHTDVVTECAVTPDGRCIVSASEDHTLKVWDLETGTEIATLTASLQLADTTRSVSNRLGVARPGSSAAVHPARPLVAFAVGHTLKVWDLETDAETGTLSHAGEIRSLTMHPARPLVAFGDSGGNVMVAELIYGDGRPLVVTAIDRGHGLVLRCPACQCEHPLDDSRLGHVIDCHADCGTRLRVNPFVVRASRRRRGLAGFLRRRPKQAGPPHAGRARARHR